MSQIPVSAQWNFDERHFWLHGKQPESTVEFTSRTGVWRIYGYQECVQVLADPTTYSSHTGRMAGIEMDFYEGNLLEMDPPDHGRLRKLVNHAFTPKVVADLEPRVAELTHELLDSVDPAGGLELVDQLAYPLPVIVIAEMLGVPSSDRNLFKQWVDAMTEESHEFSHLEADERQDRILQRAMQQMQHLRDYIGEHAAERRKRPRNDLLSTLVSAEVDGVRLSDTEVANFANVLLVNGHITTTMVLGNAVFCLLAHSGVLQEVRDDRSLVRGAIEESMRYLTPFPEMGRVTNVETTVGGITIPADQMVAVCIGAANRDPLQFTSPDTFDVRRDPNPHLTFGRGIHFCVGAPLARLESQVALNILLDRFPEMSIDPMAGPIFQASPYVTALERLPLRV
ncbi:cytochrome P450 [Lentzea jiangxiensis]|uniref:Cytochrome P450 n=1 Tax=Lentzea jiangxiensis TaxID=641025 RepID=A0A1H0WVG5_9PSEU|nr:cytochrome P450 [Lentzea jiangxiensis]SDP94216.1 hypothetical protein SAMN05421507_12354 [Lentzea jiangxiensis]